jgi:hypothetical protein
MREFMRDRETKAVEFPYRSPFHQRIPFGVQIDPGAIRRDRRFYPVFGRQIVERDGIEPKINLEECKNVNRRPIIPERFISLAQFLNDRPDMIHAVWPKRGRACEGF